LLAKVTTPPGGDLPLALITAVHAVRAPTRTSSGRQASEADVGKRDVALLTVVVIVWVVVTVEVAVEVLVTVVAVGVSVTVTVSVVVVGEVVEEVSVVVSVVVVDVVRVEVAVTVVVVVADTSETSSHHAVPTPTLKPSRNHNACASDGIGGKVNTPLWKNVQSCVPPTPPISMTCPSAGVPPPTPT